MRKIFTLFEDEFFNHLDALLKTSNLSRDFVFKIFNSINDFAYLNNSEFSTLILYVNKKKINDDLYNNIIQFISNGGGMLAFHSTSASFNNQQSFIKILGAKFIRHGSMLKYKIKPKNENDPLSINVNEFELEEELFRQQYHDEIRIHFVYQGKRIIEPIVWSNTFGKGKIVGISIGHCIETMKNKNIHSIINNSLNLITN